MQCKKSTVHTVSKSNIINKVNVIKELNRMQSQAHLHVLSHCSDDIQLYKQLKQ